MNTPPDGTTSPGSAPSSADPPADGAAATTLPEARAVRSRWFGLVWAVPLAALLIVGFLGLRALTERGIDVVVTFDTGANARVGDTKVIYQGVEGGYVRKIEINPDGRRVDMTLRLDYRAGPGLMTSTRFYLIGAKPNLNDLSSLKATLAGPTIGIALGEGGTPTRRFIGLTEPPLVEATARGGRFVLTTRQLGTAKVGSPLFFRGLEVGKVTGVQFAGSDEFRLDLFVAAPHDRLVTPGARFWISSPVQLTLTDKGANANLAHAGALFNGAIELERADPVAAPAAAPASGATSGAAPGAPASAASAPAPAPAAPGARAVARSPDGSAFPLYASERDAMRGPSGPQVPYAFHFGGAAGDMVVGSPVRLLGFEVGSVRSVALQVDPATGEPSTAVVAMLFPDKLRVAAPPNAADRSAWRAGTDAAVNRLLALGYRARLEQKPPLIGGYVIELDRIKGAGAATLIAGTPSRVPSIDAAGGIDDITGQVNDLLARINRIPLDAIGDDVRRITGKLDKLVSSPQWTTSLQRLDSTLAQVDKMMADTAPQIAPLVARLNRVADEVGSAAAAARGVVGGDGGGGGGGGSPDASLPAAIRELTDAARSIRSLADYLGRHPESLLRGRGQARDLAPESTKE